MARFHYRTAAGVEYSLDGELTYAGIASDFRSYEWSYTLGAKRVTGLTRNARTVDLEIVSISIDDANELRRAFERDVIAQTPGEFVADGWLQRAYVLEGELRDIIGPNDYLAAKFHVVLLDGYWRKPVTQSFQHETETVSDYLDFPYDYPHDYGIGVIPTQVESESQEESPVVLTIYGPATNPYVVIGSNRYQVNVTVTDGGYLIVDGLNHTITLSDMYGNHQNVFDAGVRGTGAGSGTYIFETLKPGLSTVTWPSGFGFDLTHYDIEGVPPWSR